LHSQKGETVQSQPPHALRYETFWITRALLCFRLGRGVFPIALPQNRVDPETLGIPGRGFGWHSWFIAICHRKSLPGLTSQSFSAAWKRLDKVLAYAGRGQEMVSPIESGFRKGDGPWKLSSQFCFD